MGETINVVQMLSHSLLSYFSVGQLLNLHIWGASRVNIALLWSWFTKCVPWRLTPNLNCQLGTARDWWWGIMIVYVLHLHPIFWCVLVMMLTVVWRSVPEIKAAQQHFWARWLFDQIRVGFTSPSESAEIYCLLTDVTSCSKMVHSITYHQRKKGQGALERKPNLVWL